eukprot:TRINITY_DN16965_c0_g1_i1.p1 TRINITY_DN16965_c0_g1~~TRINITY_DN16965_c0_g1_i1.p1  ORF type:complete len:184 (-),score=14.77 TRINITY_DN16965_c0_g1_i1:123-674(-)
MSSWANHAGFDEQGRYRSDVRLGRLRDSFRFHIGSAATYGTEGRIQGFRYPTRSGDGGHEEPKSCVNGWACRVQKLKPGRLGCAIVKFDSAQVREEVMNSVEAHSTEDVHRIMIKGMRVSLYRHVEERQSVHSREVAECIFIAWPHASEKNSPLLERNIVDAFDIVVARIKAPNPAALPMINL